MWTRRGAGGLPEARNASQPVAQVELPCKEDVHFEWQAIRQIAKRIQNEETWKLVFKQIEQERS